MALLRWLARHDPGYLALRRAARTAIGMPSLFALCVEVFHNAEMATFAGFGSFALLLLADFSGPMYQRLQSQLALVLTGAVFICVGTLASGAVWLAALAMALVGFAVLFAGVVSSVLAGATTSLLLSFILPVSLPAPPPAIGDRLIGWSIAGVFSLLAIALLWPAPVVDRLRGTVIAASRAVAARLTADVAEALDGSSAAAAERTRTAAASEEAVAALHRVFLATPYRPTGLSTPARTVVRLVDELTWLRAMLPLSRTSSPQTALTTSVCAVNTASAKVLAVGAGLLDRRGGDPSALDAAVVELRAALRQMETQATAHLSTHRSLGRPEHTAVLSSLDPTFRAQEMTFAVSSIADNIARTARAEHRSWWERLLGRQPDGVPGVLAAAAERAGASAGRNSVWLHNSVRGGIGLGLAVLVAELSGVQHSFWVVLGTLSVLRSNALNTGQNVLRALLGTVAGFVVGALALAAIGTSSAVLWVVLPIAVLVAGVAPAAISFAAGQAAFTLTLVILFNITSPTGWQVGLLRIEDVALGCAVSLLVGALFWPRGAAAALRQAIADAYAASADYLAATVAFGMVRCDPRADGAPPTAPAAAAAAGAARRLDDAFRSYLAERGSKPVPLAQASALVTGVAGLRLAADAVLDLWQRDDGSATGDRAAVRAILLAETTGLTRWFSELGARLVGGGALPSPMPPDVGRDRRLVAAVDTDLRQADGQATATAVRIVWTGEHLDAIRRLQATLVGPSPAQIRSVFPVGATAGSGPVEQP
jgi:uncharacterized membrane protein YccC